MLETYQQRLTTIVLPALAEVRIRELTVPRLHAVLTTTRQRHSAASAKTVRTILSGVCGFAVRYGAPTNPVRDVGRIEGRKKASRSLTLDELRNLLAKLDADEIAARHDLPDLVRWYIGTGERTRGGTGRALASRRPRCRHGDVGRRRDPGEGPGPDHQPRQDGRVGARCGCRAEWW
jgi:integrase